MNYVATLNFVIEIIRILYISISIKYVQYIDDDVETSQDQKQVFSCNEKEGHVGHFVYVRDDREDKEYFGLCEVEVFEHKGGSNVPK